MALYNASSGKSDEDRQRTNAPLYPKVPVNWDGAERGPELPEHPFAGDGIKWCAHTVRWWNKWRNSPQSMVMLESDWELMMETAILHDMLWNPYRKNVGAVSMTQLASEIRRRVAAYGASFEDRVKLRMEIKTPDMLAKDDAAALDAARSFVNYENLLQEAPKE